MSARPKAGYTLREYDPLKVDLSRGACVGAGDPGSDVEGAQAAHEFATAYCDYCVVHEPCLEQGIAYDETGVWGGLTQEQRRELKKSRRIG